MHPSVVTAVALALVAVRGGGGDLLASRHSPQPASLQRVAGEARPLTPRPVCACLVKPARLRERLDEERGWVQAEVRRWEAGNPYVVGSLAPPGTAAPHYVPIEGGVKENGLLDANFASFAGEHRPVGDRRTDPEKMQLALDDYDTALQRLMTETERLIADCRANCSQQRRSPRP